MLTDGRMDGRTDDGRKVITIAHSEHSSGELINLTELESLMLHTKFHGLRPFKS